MITLSTYLSSPRRMDNESRDRQDDIVSDKDASRPRIVRSDELLPQGARELWIEHGDEMYRLRLTRSGKLYLTK